MYTLCMCRLIKKGKKSKKGEGQKSVSNTDARTTNEKQHQASKTLAICSTHVEACIVCSHSMCVDADKTRMRLFWASIDLIQFFHHRV